MSQVWCPKAKAEEPHDPHWHTVMAGNIVVAGGQCMGFNPNIGSDSPSPRFSTRPKEANMPRTLVLTLELDDEFDDDDVMEELADVLRDHIKTGNILELHTGESDQAGIYLDEVGDSIPCYVKKVEEIA